MPEFDDAWHVEWYRRMEEGGGNIIAAMRHAARVRERRARRDGDADGPGRAAGHGRLRGGGADATRGCGGDERVPARGGLHMEDPKPFPLSVQISVNLLRNINKGKAIAESTIVHGGRTLTVVESKVRDEAGGCCAS